MGAAARKSFIVGKQGSAERHWRLSRRRNIVFTTRPGGETGISRKALETKSFVLRIRNGTGLWGNRDQPKGIGDPRCSSRGLLHS